MHCKVTQTSVSALEEIDLYKISKKMVGNQKSFLKKNISQYMYINAQNCASDVGILTRCGLGLWFHRT